MLRNGTASRRDKFMTSLCLLRADLPCLPSSAISFFDIILSCPYLALHFPDLASLALSCPFLAMRIVSHRSASTLTAALLATVLMWSCSSLAWIGSDSSGPALAIPFQDRAHLSWFCLSLSRPGFALMIGLLSYLCVYVFVLELGTRSHYTITFPCNARVLLLPPLARF